MNSYPFLRSALIGFAISAVNAAIYLSLAIVLDQYSALAISCSTATFAYVLHLLSISKSSFGRISVMAVFITSSILLLLSAPPISIIALTNATFIWLIRACYFHKHTFIALADLILSGLAFVATIAAATQSHSVFISFWCFFLAQSMILPSLRFGLEQVKAPIKNGDDQESSRSQFQYAYNDAESALTRLMQHQQ